MNKKAEPKKKKSLRKIITDIVFFGALIIIFFTPIGKPVNVWLRQQLSFSPSIKKDTNQEVLQDYNWHFLNDSGEAFNLSEVKGKVLFINSWATWCPPCIAEMPSIQALYNTYRNNDDIVFIFATTDTKEIADEFMAKNNYDLPNYYIRSASPALLQSKSIPTTYLISKDGNIVIKKVGSADWNAKKVHETIEQLLAQ